MAEIRTDERRSRGMAPKEDGVRIAAIFRAMFARPSNSRGDILGRIGIGKFRREPVIRIHADKAVRHGPDHHIVISKIARPMFVAAGKAAAVNEEQYGFAGTRFGR